ncbi:putative photosynthetic complex assembly protein 2 [Jannaschia faecimaris]|uniref:Putative photosynthetic complex assembly protein 2 n=1 Tax=Jannaschia faecimaris TaxID=1244108 RepID=A0A1H3TCC5_9RHOB|nr:putative photosynthetic complex assembly protein PuhE [Jannaschia faecimaris]SDZ47874.1 putative photosynthetic complex assembly protein 2 [Jannaschia faecimaris]
MTEGWINEPWMAAVFAIFAWWFSTGAILFVVRRSDAGDRTAHGRSVVLGVPFLALGIAGLIVTSGELTAVNIYLSFASVLLVWGWVELAFLAGVITGPERGECPPLLTGWARFVRAWTAMSHHEILLLLTLFAVMVVSHPAENPFGLYAYLILFFARISAKLNLFFGVPRINTEFLPHPLQHLKSYFRQGPISIAFPISVTILSVATLSFAAHLISVNDPATTIGFALLTTLAGLAALEHWLMVVPLPDAKLWRWMLPATTTHQEGTDP